MVRLVSMTGDVAGCDDRLRYCILDPTGNITALVESAVPVDLQPTVAAELMARHPEVEQVGFVRFAQFVRFVRFGPAGEGAGKDAGAWPELPAMRMAGGEFCGNATMSAAALYALRAGVASGPERPAEVRMRVSGAAGPVEVELCRRADDAFDARVHMPQAREVCDVELAFADAAGTLPLVRMEGISHLVVERTSAFFGLADDADAAERAVRAWCEELGTCGLGLMFLEEDKDEWRLTPLVYVPGSGTVFWERSCASGSAATGMYRAAREGAPVALALREPGGVLRVESDPARGETWLAGSVRLQGSYEA